MIEQATLEELFAPKNRGGVKGFVMVRQESGLTREPIVRMGDHDFGKFEGKVGTKRRSAKGRTRTMPNGSRRYVRSWFEQDAVVAYSLRK